MLEKEIQAHKTGLEIAVIGMAARFPGARNIDEFWDNLINGKETLTCYTDEELKEAGIDAETLKNPAYVKSYGWLADIEFFDYSFFGYTPLEAELMDPQLCILHECAIQALENAGYDCYTCADLIGLYAGASHNFDWQARAELSGKNNILGRFASLQLNDKDFLATRIAHRLSLKGPAVTLDTACSTSLVAIHLACQGLLSGDCDMALAGGVSIPVLMKRGYLYQEGMLNSPDGHCRAFDEKAKGCNFGNGVGLVVLKRLEEAVADGDTIHVVIKGSSINNDGDRKSGYTAPSIEGQAEVIRNAHEMSEVEPESIGYVETHGTATPLGDPVEIEGLKTAFDSDKKHFCRIGSVKTNIGHLEIAAGIAGFIKTALVLKNRLIPPSLYFKTPNPKIDFENSPFVVNAELTSWKRGEGPRRAGVSSFGIGGTNAHVVLEEAPEVSGSVGQLVSESVSQGVNGQRTDARGGSLCPPLKSRDYQLILLSAKTQSALDKMTIDLMEYFQYHFLNHDNHENPVNPGLTLDDASYTLQVGRPIHQYRRMLVCKDVPEAVQLLSSPVSEKVKTVYSREDNRPIIFMFSGLGSQYVNMGRDLYENEPVFRREMDHCFEILNSLLDYHIKEILYPGEMDNRSYRSNTSYNSYKSHIDQPETAQIVIFIFEYALVQLLMSWGIRPHAMIGYSFGEYTAACAAGVFSLEDGLKLVAARGRLIQQAPQGAMLSVPLPGKAITSYLTPGVSLAIDNGPSCIVSGPAAAVDAFEKQMKNNRLVCMPVPVDRALHSPAMTPVLQEFAAILGTIQFNQPQIPYISNVSGDWAAEQEVVLLRYWTTHLSSTVRFADGMRVLLKEPNSIFVEIGPGRDISALTQRYIEESGNQGCLVLNLVKQSHQDTTDVYLVLNRLGMLWLHGQSIDWHGFYGEEKRQRIPLPAYPFEGQRCWIDSDVINIKESVGELPGRVGIHQPPDFVHWFYMPSWSRQTLLRPVHQGVSQQLKPNCLLFLDDCGIGLRLAKQLKQEGHHVITVEAGTEFLEKSTEVFVICPQQPRHYSRLFDELRSRELVPRRIVHLWAVTPEVPGRQCPDWSENLQDKGFYSLVYLAKAIGQLTVTPTMNEPLHIAVVTNQMQEVTGEELLSPAKTTVIGPVKVIPQELPGVRCRSIDIVLPGPGDSQEEKIVQQLLEEISTTSVDTEIAYRGNFRWVRAYKPIRVENSSKKTTKLREGGVYLVTGGLGKIGFLLARYLAKTVKAKLVLTARSTFPPRETWEQWLAQHGNENPISEKIKQMKEMEETGAQFRVFSADAADKEKMQTVIAHTIQEWGTINGVVHGAGIMNPGSFHGLQELTRSSCQEHFRPKVEGTLNLGELLQDQPLDFVLFLSSISTVLGGIHFTAYAAANCFMDALARKYNRFNNGRWISVDWDGMDEEKTRKAFDWILSLDNLDQVVASNGGNLQERIDQWVGLESLGENDQVLNGKSRERQSRPNLLSTYIPPETETEQVLVEAWQRLFGLEPVGIEDDFIELGGDSLRAIMMINQVHKELNVTVPLVEFFNHPTIKWLARYTSHARIDVFQSITPVEKKEYYPLSSAQRRLYILHKMNPTALGYNLASTMLLEGKCDMDRLEYSFRQLIQRHENLRASFHLIHGETVQEVHDEVEFEIQYDQVKVEEEGEGTGGLAPLPIETPAPLRSRQPAMDIIGSFIHPFDLSRAPLMRMALIKIEADKHILVVDMHHIVHDGISQTILFKEFMAFYTGEELPGLKLQYKDYAGWQKLDMKKETVKKQELYWLEQFQGEIPILNLPYDFPRPVIQSYDGGTEAFKIDKKETEALKTLVRSEDATLFMVLLSIYYVFLSKLSGQEDIVIGTLEAGRKHPDLQPIIGFFLSTLALRNYPCPDKSFSDFLKEVKKSTLESFENQDYPFEDLVERVTVNRDLSRSPMFDVMFILHTQWASRFGQVQEVPERDAKDLTFKFFNYEKNTSEFDLTLIGFDEGDRLSFKFEYCTRLFEVETIRRFIDYFETILSAVLENPGQPIEEIGIIPGSEKRRLLNDFNDTTADYPMDKTIHHLFEQQVERTPDHVALVGKEEGWKDRRIEGKKKGEPFGRILNACGEMHLSYRELNEKANRLAHLLREKGVQTGTIAGVLVERAPQMMVGLLGILKTGSAYLPLDPEHPEARVKYIIENSSTDILLTQEHLINKYQGIHFAGEVIDILDENLYRRTSARKERMSSLDPAYIIYTSGSTGNPKGVVITHQNAVNFITGMTAVIDFSPGKTILALTTISFDIFFLETLLPVTRGLKVVIADESRQKDPRLLRELITGNRVNMVQVTPSRLQILASFHNDLTGLGGFEELIVGGEAFPIHLFKNIKEHFHGKIYNVYGPTETTIWSTVKDLSRCVPEELNIGRPILNTQVYIVDKHQRILPLGAVGELLIGGDGVACGYLNNPELTAAKFINYKPNDIHAIMHPCNHASMQRHSHPPIPPLPHYPIYLTGDLAWWLPDGNIEFLGRIDTQVKIRGFRIELGEIETHLKKIPTIKDAVVLLREDHAAERYLCAYLVSRDEKQSETSELREVLSKNLPDYMIPAYFLAIDSVPLTPNGKIDRGALERIKFSPAAKTYTAPRDPIEQKLVDLWSEVLFGHPESPKIGIDHNFFQLGGHSLKAIQLASGIHREFHAKISLEDLFKYSTIRQMARIVSGTGKTGFTGIKKAEKKDFYPLSFNQKRLWIIHRLDPGSLAYNMTGKIESGDAMDERAVKKALEKLCQNHESLRTGFKEVDGEPVQFIMDMDTVRIPFTFLDISSLGDKEKKAKADRVFWRESTAPFDLSGPPLFNILLLKLDDRHYELIINIHHIVSDGWSLEVLKKDFSHLYEGYKKGRDIEPGALRFHYTYKDFAQWQNKRLNSRELNEKAARYWRGKIEKGFPPLKLPYDSQSKLTGGKDTNSDTGAGSGYRFVIGRETKEGLNRLAIDGHTTLFMVMFAAYNILLSYFTNQEEIVCSIISAGREHISMQKMVGLFVNAIVVNHVVDPGENFNDFLRSTSGNVLEALEYQHYPIELVLDEMKIPFPEISTAFNMFNMQDNSGEIKDDEMTAYHIETVHHIKYDMVLFVTGYENCLEVHWHYKKACFKPGTIQWIAHEYQRLLKEVARDIGHLPEEKRTRKKIKDYKLFDPTEIEIKGNRVKPGNEYPEFKKEEIEQSIVSRFEAQVKKYPDKVAVKVNGKALTYDALNQYANRVARVVTEKYDDRYRLNEKEKIRYNRQLMLHKWGIEEQEKLKSTTVFAAGAGGSGSPLIMQLALMGIGTIIVCDFDEVELSNLNRQLLHDESRIGMNKALSAQMTVKRINPNVKVIPISQKLTRENVHELVRDAEIIFDNLDDLEAKFVLSEYAVANQVPHIISSMIDLNAYAAVFHSPHTPCFHCIHDRNLLEDIQEIKARVKNYQKSPNPVAPPPLFMSTGFAANEAVKILLGFENPAYNKYFFMNQRGTPDIVNSQGYRIITYTFTDHFKKISKRQGFDWDVGWGGKFLEELEIEPDPSCPVCGDAAKKRNNRREIAAIKEKEPVKPAEKAVIDNEPGESGDKIAAAALLFDHDTHMIAGIIGTLKANKAYVPLDPSYPPQRLQYMLEDSGARVIITDNRNFNLAVKVRDNVNKRIPIINVNKIYHDERIPGENLGLPIKPGNIAYILYTSGSTGTPKGVIQNHRNVLHFARVYTNALHIHPGDRLTLFSSYGFDAAKMDIFGALLNGAVLYPYDIKQEESLDRLPHWLRNEGLTIFHSIPTVYRYFIDMLTRDESFPEIRFVVLGGEAVHKKDVDKYKHYFPGTCIFINGLGPTESTVTLQYFINKESEVLKDSVPVGYPVDETGVFLINKAGEEARLYEVGEIVFKSDYLALGYLNHREKTAEVFVTNPLTGSGRVYRTGDLGRRLPDGTIEYVGRKDFQVKVRGYRIELAEVESKLDTITGIKKSVVVCQQDPNRECYLAAFYMKNQEETVDELYVTRELKASLPDYMIPNVFWHVEEFPLTATGKIDRKALTKWKKGSREPEVPYAPPRDPIESKLVEMWQEVLKSDRIGIDDNFFVSGGNSLKAIVMISKIHKAFHVKLPLAEVFKTPTVKALARYITGARPALYVPIPALESRDYYKLSANQKRLWIIQQYDPGSSAYNIGAEVRLEDKIDQGAIKKAMAVILKRHESLRTGFTYLDDEPVQFIMKEVVPNFKFIDISSMNQEAKEKKKKYLFSQEAAAPFDLSRPPLLRALLVKLDEQHHELLFNMHHIVTDGWSMGILKREFLYLYEGYQKGEEVVLEPVRLQYKDFSGWQNKQENDKELKEKAHRYWRKIVETRLPALNLSYDSNFQRKDDENMDIGAYYSFIVDEKTRDRLNRLAIDNHTTLFVVMFAAYNLLLSLLSGQKEILCHVISAGRDHFSLQEIVGFFVNAIVVKQSVDPEIGFNDFLDQVKHNVLETFQYQNYPLELVLEELNLNYPPVSAAFNMLNIQQDIPGIGSNDSEFHQTEIPRNVKFDMLMLVTEHKNVLGIRWNYKKACFKPETIEFISKGYQKLLMDIAGQEAVFPG